jgi:hypothetical protein
MSSSGDQSVCFEICAQRNLLPSFVAAGICDLHMQTLQGCDTKSVHTICANMRLRTFASHDLGPRKLARRYLRACSKDEEGRVGSFVAHVIRERSWAGRSPESTKWNRDSLPPNLPVSPVPLRR